MPDTEYPFLDKTLNEIMKEMCVQSYVSQYVDHVTPGLKIPSNNPILEKIKKGMIANIWAFNNDATKKVFMVVEVDLRKFKERRKGGVKDDE